MSDPPRADAPEDLRDLAAEMAGCRQCPRLVAERTAVADVGRGAYRSRPVPGFGDPSARIHVLGLATAPHGGNRTGRAFTGNRSADTLVAAMHRVGLANQPTSRHADDGLRLDDTWMASAVRCPPPGHRPTRSERDACLGWLTREVAALPRLRVMVCLGHVAWNAACAWSGASPRPRFGHGVPHVVDGGPRPGLVLVGCYHPSPQNTASGRLTPAMLDSVLRRARHLVAVDDRSAHEEPA